MKKYLIRVAKYIIYWYLLFVLIFGVMWFFMEETPPSPMHLFNQRLAAALLLLGFVYPFIGFKRAVITLPSGGREQHEQKICEAIEINGFRREAPTDAPDKITFVAVSPLRRLLAVYEDRITLTFPNSATIAVSGLRRDVARVRLRINDYIRYAK